MKNSKLNLRIILLAIVSYFLSSTVLTLVTNFSNVTNKAISTLFSIMSFVIYYKLITKKHPSFIEDYNIEKSDEREMMIKDKARSDTLLVLYVGLASIISISYFSEQYLILIISGFTFIVSITLNTLLIKIYKEKY